MAEAAESGEMREKMGQSNTTVELPDCLEAGAGAAEPHPARVCELVRRALLSPHRVAVLLGQVGLVRLRKQCGGRGQPRHPPEEVLLPDRGRLAGAMPSIGAATTTVATISGSRRHTFSAIAPPIDDPKSASARSGCCSVAHRAIARPIVVNCSLLRTRPQVPGDAPCPGKSRQ